MSTTMTMAEKLRSRVIAGPPCLEVSDDEIAQLEKELASLLECIKSKPTLASASNELTKLSDFQELLATMFFKYDVELTENQKFVVRNFDRGDDPDLQSYFFKALKTA